MERVSSHLIANARARLRCFILTLAPAIIAAAAPHTAVAGPLVFPPLNQFNVTNIAADGIVTVSPGGSSFMLVGGNTGSGLPGETDFTLTADSSGLVIFDWLYTSLDDPGFDGAGYLIDTMYFPFADADRQFGTSSFSVAAGQTYGWWVYTVDNAGEPGILNVSFDPVAQTPEPASIILALSALMLTGVVRIRRAVRSRFAGFRRGVSVAATVAFAAGSGAAQVQNHYTPVDITGQLALVRMVNASQLAAAASPAFAARLAFSRTTAVPQGPEISKLPSFFPRPQPFRPAFTIGPYSESRVFGADAREARASGPRFAEASLPVTPAVGGAGFNGLSHYDQRNANSGNQFSVEPPNPSIAVANGFVLEGVNNAVRVFSETGAPLLPALASNQLFGVAPAIDRNTGINGVYPTDMRVYFDHGINRWFVLQRSQDNDVEGNPLSESHLYIAVSQGTDPTGIWNIYVLDTTHASNPGCPCIADFPQIGSDQYGFYVSANEYDALYLQPVDSVILAISKTGLGSGAAAPSTLEFSLPLTSGFEFAIQPATTPPGASNFVASGGVEYLVSSQAFYSINSLLALWALSNTASLQGSNPSLLLTQTLVSALSYTYPGVANQKPGPLPYGSSLFPPGQLAFIDGNIDSRIQSVSYAGGRLYVSLPTQVIDDAGTSVVGAGYVILSPTFRSSAVAASVLKKGYVSVTNNHVLRPAISVNPKGQGVIAFTLVGPDYYPSAAFTTFDANTSPSAVRIVGAGAGPEDGFTGYFPSFSAPVARWGDYSTAVTSADGSIWSVSEYIPAGNRTPLANWGTYISRYVP